VIIEFVPVSIGHAWLAQQDDCLAGVRGLELAYIVFRNDLPAPLLASPWSGESLEPKNGSENFPHISTLL
jgi:hypothetical protein